MKKLIFLLFCMGFGCQGLLFAQDYEQTKKILEVKYTTVYYIGNYGGWFLVQRNDKEGACDLSGKEIVSCKYDQVVLHDGYYSIKLNNKEGACDLTGKEIVPCIYDNLLYSGGFNYKDAGGNWVLIPDAPRLPKDERAVVSTSGLSSEAGTTAAATTPKNTTKATPDISEETKMEDMSFFINNHYAKQSNDYTKLHLISFTDKNTFKYTILDVLTSEKLAEQQGTFQYNDGKVVVILTDNTILRFSIVKLTPLSIGLLFENSTLTKYAKWFSSEDLFTTNSTLYWKNVRSDSGTMNTNTNINTPSGQQPKRVCAYCNGTGKKCVLKTVPTYGTHSSVEKRCHYCGQVLVDGVVHVLQTCTMCNGTGYR